MPNKPNVIIVDDEPNILMTLSAILELKGLQVDTAENGRQAVDKAKDQHFDIALLDIIMPEMNGVETYREFKKISPSTKTIMITGYGDDHPLVEEARNEGIEHLLHKPVDMEFLLNLFESIV